MTGNYDGIKVSRAGEIVSASKGTCHPSLTDNLSSMPAFHMNRFYQFVLWSPYVHLPYLHYAQNTLTHTHGDTHTKYTFTDLCTHILHTHWHTYTHTTHTMTYTLTHKYTHKPHTAHTLTHVYTCTHTHTDMQHPHIRISKHIHTHLKFLLTGTYRILQLPFQLKLVFHKSYQ